MFDPSAHHNPYLSGLYAPVSTECSGPGVTIEGDVPADLDGVYVRNGPNPVHTPRGKYHWFDGDGMVHAVRIQNGEVSYRNRWIRTDHLNAENEAGRTLWSGLMESTRDNPKGAPYKDTANTDLVLFRDALLATWYICGEPYRIDPITLETLGVDDFGGERDFKVSAHAKVDPRTNELVFLDYGPRPPYLTYGVVGADGGLAHFTAIDLPGPRLPHDIALTENYSILMDLPVFPRPEALKLRRWLVQFDRELPARFGVIPRHGSGSEIRWFEADPCYVYHAVNAWEEDNAIVMIGCKSPQPIPDPDSADGELSHMMATLRVRAHLHRWRFDLETGQTHEEQLDDRVTEFPTIDDRVLGAPSRVGYLSRLSSGRTLGFEALVKYDIHTGSAQEYVYGDGVLGSEAPFAPRVGSQGEDDGYVLSFTSAPDGQSELIILDAADVASGPVARVRMPQRMPLGFHACWVPGDRLPG